MVGSLSSLRWCSSNRVGLFVLMPPLLSGGPDAPARHWPPPAPGAGARVHPAGRSSAPRARWVSETGRSHPGCALASLIPVLPPRSVRPADASPGVAAPGYIPASHPPARPPVSGARPRILPADPTGPGATPSPGSPAYVPTAPGNAWARRSVAGVPAPHMLGNDLLPATDHHPVYVSLDHHRVMGVFHRHRIVVGVKPHQRLGVGDRLRRAAGRAGDLRKGTEGRPISRQPLA